MSAFIGNKTALINIARVAAVLVFLGGLIKVTQHTEHAQRVTAAISGAAKALPVPWRPTEPTFYDIGMSHNTDKVTHHAYQDMYEMYLPAIRHKRIKMLEIGLGCKMSYGPGHSYRVWLEYFPDVDLYFMEYDEECAEKWADETSGATIFTGDQGDPATLERFLSLHGGDFDVIIDDGGHTMTQQMLSLEHLWKAVKPGGLYFCEDLETSWIEDYGATPGAITMVQFIHAMVEDLTTGEKSMDFPDVENVVHIDCAKQICAFQKRE